MTQYLVTAWDYTDPQALERRMAARTAHLEGAKRLKEQGNFILAGAMLNANQEMIGSTMVLQFETPEALEHWKAHEPYILQKVWEKISIHPLRVANI